MKSIWPKPDIRDCSFYHSMTFPSGQEVQGEWDLRGKIEDYVGHIEIPGRRILDVGAGSGHIAFELEKMKGTIVSLDVRVGHLWDLLPYHKVKIDELEWIACVNRFRAAYWYAYHEYQSQNEIEYCDLYNPPELGWFDYSFFGAVLLHLRDPFRVLENFSRRTLKSIIVTEMYKPQLSGVQFAPDYPNEKNLTGWWYLDPLVIIRMLDVLGFSDTKMITFPIRSVRHNQDQEFYCVVASR